MYIVTHSGEIMYGYVSHIGNPNIDIDLLMLYIVHWCIVYWGMAVQRSRRSQRRGGAEGANGVTGAGCGDPFDHRSRKKKFSKLLKNTFVLLRNDFK